MEQSTTLDTGLVSQERGWASSRLLAGLGLSLLGIVLLAAVFPYQHGALAERHNLSLGLWRYVLVNTEWLYCPIIPFIVVFLVWREWPTLRAVPLGGSVWGLVAIVVALVFYWIGYKADQRFIGYFSMQILVGGVVLWLLGWRFFLAVFFFWVFFAFTWPVKPLEDRLALPLRYMAASGTATVLNAIDVDTIREGTNLVSAPETFSPKGSIFSLGVDTPCSGLRSLFALIMITVLYAYLSLRLWRTRLSLIALAIPIALVGNIIRMLILVFGTIFFGSEFAVGSEADPSSFHLGSGFVIFIFALFALFALSQFLERFDKIGQADKTAESSRVGASGISVTQALLPLALSLGTLLVCYFSPVADSFAELGVKTELPENFQGIFGIKSKISEKERRNFDPTGTQLIRRVYIENNRHSLIANVIINGAIENLHRPEVCLPSQDWKLSKLYKKTLNPPNYGKEVPVHIYLCNKRESNESLLYLYTFVGHNRITAQYDTMKTISIWDNFSHALNHRWAMIGLLRPNLSNMSDSEQQNAIDSFAETATDYIDQLLIRH